MKKISLLLFLISIPFIAKSKTIYFTPEEALKIIFSASEEVVIEQKSLTADQKIIVEKQAGKISKLDWKFFVAKSGENIDGYALIDNEVGKTEPITFMTALMPDGSVKAVEILVYRESHGSEVKEQKFRDQFKGKNSSDPIRVGQDVKNVTGATLSSRAVSLGVKRAVVLWKVLYGK